MTDISASRAAATSEPEFYERDGTAERVRSASSGWVVFAATVLLIAGISRVFDGIWAFHYNRALPENLQGALFGTSLSTYAWIWIGVGGLLTFVGLGYLGIGWLAGTQVGRWIGIVAAAIGGLSAMTWMAYYPVWTIMYVGLAVLAIYALVTHSRPGARSRPNP
jgi:hypothetical protein